MNSLVVMSTLGDCVCLFFKIEAKRFNIILTAREISMQMTDEQLAALIKSRVENALRGK